LKYIYREHAIVRMFERDILEADVEDAIKNGEIIEQYLDDKPYPSYLTLKYCKDRPLHVVYAINKESNEIYSYNSLLPR